MIPAIDINTYKTLHTIGNKIAGGASFGWYKFLYDEKLPFIISEIIVGSKTVKPNITKPFFNIFFILLLYVKNTNLFFTITKTRV